MTIKPVPKGYHTVTPYLFVQDAGQLIDFLKLTNMYPGLSSSHN